MKTNILVVFTLILSFCFLTSCKSKEDRVVGRIQSLQKEMQENAMNWDADDWADALEDLEDIYYYYTENMDKFTPEQNRNIGRALGNLAVTFIREGKRTLGNQFAAFLEQFLPFLRGFMEGVREEYDQEEFDRIDRELQERLNVIFEENEIYNY